MSEGAAGQAQAKPIQRDAVQAERLWRLRREGRVALLASVLLALAAQPCFRIMRQEVLNPPAYLDGLLATLLGGAGVLAWFSLVRVIQSVVLPERSIAALLADGCSVVAAMSFALWLLVLAVKLWR